MTDRLKDVATQVVQDWKRSENLTYLSPSACGRLVESIMQAMQPLARAAAELESQQNWDDDLALEDGVAAPLHQPGDLLVARLDETDAEFRERIMQAFR